MSIGSIFKAIGHFFTSGKAERILTEANRIAPKVLEIAQKVADITPNKSDDEMVSAFTKYQIEWTAHYNANPGEARRKIVQVLAAKIFPASAQKAINLAIEIAAASLEK